MPATSFALEYRRRMLAQEAQRTRQRGERGRVAFVTPHGRSAAESPRHTRPGRVLAALMLAALLCLVFNSEALMHYTRGLVETSLGRRLYAASENWHGLMDKAGATRLMLGMREQVSHARDAGWDDVARRIGLDGLLGKERLQHSLARPGESGSSGRSGPNS